jgi:PAS domain-containing protein
MTARTVSSPIHRPRPDDHGWFGWNIARGTAVWSDSVHRLHGYEPAQVIPSSALTFHHKHPDDLYGCIDALHAAMVEDRLVVHEHRLLDAQGQARSVVMVCRPVSDSQGRMRNLRGFLLPTDVDLPRQGGTFGDGQASLTRLLEDVFEVSEPAARVLLGVRRPLTARRSQRQQDFARHYRTAGCSDLRRTLEDSLFPLEHLTLEPLDLAA